VTGTEAVTGFGPVISEETPATYAILSKPTAYPRVPVDVQPGGRTRWVTWTHAIRGRASTGDWFRELRTREVALGSPSYPVPPPDTCSGCTRRYRTGSTTRTAFAGADFDRRCLPEPRTGTSKHRFQPARHGVEPHRVSRSFVALPAGSQNRCSHSRYPSGASEGGVRGPGVTPRFSRTPSPSAQLDRGIGEE